MMADGNSEHLTVPPVSSMRCLLLEQVKKLSASLTPQDLSDTLSTLRRIFDNIIQHPNDENYRQIKLTSKTFSSKVWQYPAGEELMKISGWVVEDDHVRLRDDSCVRILAQLLWEKLEEENPNVSKKNISKRPKDVSTDCAAGVSSLTDLESLKLSGNAAIAVASAILSGNGTMLKRLLSQYTCPVRCFKIDGVSLIGMAYFTRQIGIVRILVDEYGVDANISYNDDRSYLMLLEGSDSTVASQSLVIQFIQDFNLDVHKQNKCYSALHLAMLHKLFTVVKFLVEESKVDVNCIMKVDDGTPLHMAYGMGEESIAQYLIEHGANQDAIDDHGRKPKDYRFYTNNGYYFLSQYHRKRSVIIKNSGPELDNYRKLCEQGLADRDAVDATFEKFPNLQRFIVSFNSLALDAIPTLNELNYFITDMAPSYYDVGLQLGIDNRKLKLIKEDHISFSGLEKKCLGMLEVWLNVNSTFATWKKLCEALERQGLNFLAGKIKDAIVDNKL